MSKYLKTTILGFGTLALLSVQSARAATLTFSFTTAQIEAAYSASAPTEYPLSGVGLYRVWARPAIVGDVLSPSGQTPGTPMNGYDINGGDPNDKLLVAVPATWGGTNDDWVAAIDVRPPSAPLVQRWARWQDLSGTGQNTVSFISNYSGAITIAAGAPGTINGQTGSGQHAADTGIWSVKLMTNAPNVTVGSTVTWIFAVAGYQPGINPKQFDHSFYLDAVATPEPGTTAFGALGLSALFLLRHRRRKSSSVS
jgi:MYXO-CTERM domain-containing protein